MGYIEPAPIKDKENPFESMMSRFRIAAQHLGLNEETYNVLKSPDKQVIINIPITMDDGSIQVFVRHSYPRSSRRGIMGILKFHKSHWSRPCCVDDLEMCCR